MLVSSGGVDVAVDPSKSPPNQATLSTEEKMEYRLTYTDESGNKKVVKIIAPSRGAAIAMGEMQLEDERLRWKLDGISCGGDLRRVYRCYFGDKSFYDVGPVRDLGEAFEIMTSHVQRDTIEKIETLSHYVYMD